MSTFITLDGDRYCLTIPSDEDWRGISENFPEYENSSFVVRRQDPYLAILVESRHVIDPRHQYPLSLKLAEAEVLDPEQDGSYKLHLYDTHMWGFHPMLIPVGLGDVPISSQMAKEHPNGEFVTGGSVRKNDELVKQFIPIQPLADETFKIGDTCPSEPGSIIKWVWWDGNLICMSPIANVWGKDLEKLMPVFEPLLLQL